MKLIDILPLITVWLQVRVLGAHYPGALYLRSQLGIGNVNDPVAVSFARMRRSEAPRRPPDRRSIQAYGFDFRSRRFCSRRGALEVRARSPDADARR
jgi:hypothetical protein